MTDLLELNRRFGIPDVLIFDPGNGGLPRARVTTPLAEAEVYLHGAHVTHYRPHGHRPVLFMSASSWFEPGKPIRGGVPICFPWFGPRADDPSAPGHGFARLNEWTVTGAVRLDDGSLSLTFQLGPDERSRSLWPHEFELTYVVAIGQSLQTMLQVRNTGSAAFRFEEALHSYFEVGDVRQVAIAGLRGTPYLDQLQGRRELVQQEDQLRFTAETDRIYRPTAGPYVLTDIEGGRRITVSKRGSNSTVVWNPWVNKSRAMPDFGDEEWPGMVCIETCNVADQAVTLRPGEAHEMVAVVGVG